MRWLVFLLFPFLVYAKGFVDSPARAVWESENKITLTLPGNLNVNGVRSYYLKNIQSKIKFPLYVVNAHDKKVELEVGSFNQSDLLSIISGPLSLAAVGVGNEELDETSIQLAGLLDEKFYYSGNDLGTNVLSSYISVKLWAPTAQDVQVFLFKTSSDETPEAIVNLIKGQNGVWQSRLSKDYQNYFYQYKVTAYSPITKIVESNLVTDPYSKSLSINSEKSQIVDVSSQGLSPAGWDNLQKPKFNNITIYESHIRDLTAEDSSLAEKEKGTFVGLINKNGKAFNHLKNLADSGLSHLHLLPLNDFASVNEDRSTWEKMDLSQNFPSNSDRPQSQLNRIRNSDSFNWGYDPYHYMVPEGSYSLNPDGSSRIKELRQMVQGLNQIGLRVIVDVVFNHTYSSGADQFSVLNKIVPLYYYRLNEFGNVANSSCCSDTASEHKMMEKLMIDSVLYWAKTYKIDGFRFDLMSFHTRNNILNIKKALSNLTMAKDGVDGKSIYLYGEGWNFGSLYDKDPYNAFTQLNSYGAGVGFFNDRIRDAVRGGTTDATEKSDQGFATGLFYDFNQEIANRNTPTDLSEQKNKLNVQSDVIKIGIAGNLRDFKFKNFVGDTILASNYYFRGMPVAYSATTNETVNYVSAHDGYALWDAISAKFPFYTNGRFPSLATTEEKQRAQALSLGIAILSQGVTFIEGGSEILRSKSGDVDSYDSGDWFNHLNFDFQDNNWGKGLPPSFKNYNDWSFWSPRLNDPLTKPTKENILTNLQMVKGLIKVRSKSTLFNFSDANEIANKIKFFDNDYSNVPGLIAYKLINASEEMMVLINANKNSVNFKHPFVNDNYKLHNDYNQNIDAVLANVKIGSGEILLPGRTIVILVPKGNYR